VPEGEDVGGSFQNTPACRAPDQNGCVVSFASYRDREPPEDGALFGHTPDGRALCNLPGSLAGGSLLATPYLPADIPATLEPFIGNGPGAFADDEASDAIETPFFTQPEFIEVECVERGDFSYLEVRIHADPNDPRADDISGDFQTGWGLHLVDISLVLGELVDLAGDQTAAWLAR
jgi:hypothetical protein